MCVLLLSKYHSHFEDLLIFLKNLFKYLLTGAHLLRFNQILLMAIVLYLFKKYFEKQFIYLMLIKFNR